MVAAAFVLVVLGIVLMFVYPWAGIVVAVVGLVLAVLSLLGLGRRTATGRS